MDFGGVHVDGTVNLGRTMVDGPIDIRNAHISGSFVAFDEGFYQHSLACPGLNARNIQVGGDLDLRDLRVYKSGQNLGTGGNMELQDVKVGGIIRLATPPRTKDERGTFEPSVLVEDGHIDLTGTHASRIVLSGTSLKSKNSDRNRFMLERCKVGQLTIGGFVEDQGFFEIGKVFNVFNIPYSKNFRFPREINLTAIEVGDWDVDAKTEASGLLEASDPFDTRVYLDLENRLSRQGYTPLPTKFIARWLVRIEKLSGQWESERNVMHSCPG